MSSLTSHPDTEVGEAFLGSHSKQHGVDMIPKLWSTLPTHLIELIASKLDFSSMIMSRLVCKSWDKMVTSPAYCPPNPAAKCVLLAYNSTENILTVHNRSTNFWHSCPYNPLLCSAANIRQSGRKRLCSPAVPHGLDLIGTAGGLICFRTIGIFRRSPNHIVCNPVLKTFRNLPKMVSNVEIVHLRYGYRIWWGLAAMLFDQHTGGYKLVVVGYSDDEHYPIHEDEDLRTTALKATQVYDSLTGKWIPSYQRNRIPGGWMSFRRSYNKSVLHKGFLFVITLADTWGGGLAVMIFCMKEGTWQKQFVGPITDDWGPAYGSLAVSNGELYMVATDDNYNWSTITYWKLNVPDLQAAWSDGSLCRDADSVWQLERKMSRQSPQFPISNLLWNETKYWFSMGNNGCFYFLFSVDNKEDHDTVIVHDIAKDTWTTLHFEGTIGSEDGELFTNLCLLQTSFAQV